MDNSTGSNCVETGRVPVAEATAFVETLKNLVAERKFETVDALFNVDREYIKHLHIVYMKGYDIYQEVCQNALTDDVYQNDYELYDCVEKLLKIIAQFGRTDEMLLELLEKIESPSEFVFCTVLRALQVILDRIGDGKPRALEWSLSSIFTHLDALPMPKYLDDGYDADQAKLLEQEIEVQNLLMRYVTVNLFIDELLKTILTDNDSPAPVFRDCQFTRRNILCCFLVKLLGRPLALLDLCMDGRETNAYTVQCAKNLTESIIKCIGNPLYFLPLIEKRMRWKRRINAKKGVLEMSSLNIFLIEEKLPIEGLAIFYYMVLVQKVCYHTVPKIYSPLFLLESAIYMVLELIKIECAPLLHRCLLLVDSLLSNLGSFKIPTSSLEIDLHKNFCEALCRAMGYVPQRFMRALAIQLLREYIKHFEDEAKYLIVMNLMRVTNHTGIRGFLAVLYKDIVGGNVAYNAGQLPKSFSKDDFRNIFMQYICVLPNGETTDVIENADQIIPCLNSVRFFIISDRTNRTGFRDFIHDIDQQYLTPLRKAVNLSFAHYKAEMERLKNGESVLTSHDAEHLKLLDVQILNDPLNEGKAQLAESITRENKIKALNESFATFELLRFLLARIEECIDNPKSITVIN